MGRHTRNRVPTEPFSIEETSYWYNGLDGATKSRYKEVYNWRKRRKETWIKSDYLDREWYLWHARPALEWDETFIGSYQAFAGLVGLSLDKTWVLNGNPAPTAGNYLEANRIGGGMRIRCIGATLNDWIAIHQGGSYPFAVSRSPWLHITAELPDTGLVRILGGLSGASNLVKASTVPWTVPDDGIWVEYDTNQDNRMRFVTRSNGVSTYTDIGAPTSVQTHYAIYVNEDGNEARLIVRGRTFARHTTNIPAVQMQILAMIGTRTTAKTKDIVFLNLRAIQDSVVD